MKFVTKNQKVFKIVPENKTTYGVSLRKSMKNEVSSVMTEDEFDTLPWYIIEDSMTFISAKATCSDNDKYDEKTGMDVVAAKLDKKNHEQMAKNYERALRNMNSAMRKLEDLCDKHLKKAKAIRKDLINYYGWEE